MLKTHVKFESDSELNIKLRNRVFHVTPTRNMFEIEKSKAVKPNLNGEMKSLFGNTENGFFRLSGCVSLFDYRDYGSDKWKEHAHKCMPTMLLRQVKSISILFLSENEYFKLMSWEKWKEEEKYSQRVVPYIEIGFPGEIPLKFFTEHLVVDSPQS